jgi:hypothetical protein
MKGDHARAAAVARAMTRSSSVGKDEDRHRARLDPRGVCGVGFRVDFEAEESQTFEAARADIRAVLADAAGEDERVETAEDSGHGADLPPEAEGIVINGFGGFLHVGFQERAHVVGKAREPEEATLLVEQRGDLLRAHPPVEEMQDHAGIELSGAGAHRHAVERGEAHGGADRAPLPDRAERGAVAEMGDDDAALRERRVIGGELAGDVIVAQPVEAVAPHAFVVEAARQGEGVVDPWVAAVKGGVEAGHLHRLGEGRDGGAHPGEVVGLVQRRQRAERVEPFAIRSGSADLGASISGPPWTTRWPMPAIRAPSIRGASASRIAASPAAWSGAATSRAPPSSTSRASGPSRSIWPRRCSLGSGAVS